MSDQYSITQSRMAIEHLIALQTEEPAGSVLDAAKHGCVVLAFLEKRQELMKALVELDRRAPALAMLLQEFPGAKIMRIDNGTADRIGEPSDWADARSDFGDIASDDL